ncbi:histone acetyltransferase KAT6A-like isoform X2 [Dreissena polymorpha]|nr:histone acetyltransferase KAT6A-like isoform X2 [Dreissena polymorpha]
MRKKKAYRTTGDDEPLAKKAKSANEETITAKKLEKEEAEAVEQEDRAEEEPVRAVEVPVRINVETVRADEEPVREDEEPAFEADEEPIRADEESVKQDVTPVKLDEEPESANKEPVIKNVETVREDEEPVKADGEPVRADEDSLIEDEEAIREDVTTVREDAETIREDTEPVKADEDTVRADEELVRPEEEPVRADEEQVRVDKESVRAGEEPIRADEEPVRADEESKAHTSRYYRLLRDDENPMRFGIQAKDPKALVNLTEHVSSGSSDDHQSKYISCSETLRGAIEFVKLNYRSNLQRIAVIDAEQLSKTRGIIIHDLKALRQDLETDRAKRLADRFDEVVIEGNIGQECIVEVFKIEGYKGNYQPPVSLYIKDGFFDESKIRKTKVPSLLNCELPPKVSSE